MTNPDREPLSKPSELDKRLQIIDFAHGYRDDALQRDVLLGPARRGESAGSRRLGYVFAVQSPPTEHVPVQHHRIVLLPVPRRPLVKEIEKVFLRIPTPYSDGVVEGQRTPNPQ